MSYVANCRTRVDWLNAFFAISSAPFNGPLHYLREVFLCFAMLPFFYYCARNYSIFTTLVCVSIFLSSGTLFVFKENIVPLFIRPQIPALFLIGMMTRMQVYRSLTPIFNQYTKNYLIFIAVLFLFIAFARSNHGYNLSVGDEKLLICLRILGLLFFWGLTLKFSEMWFGQKLVLAESLTFFVFCSHYPFMYLIGQVTGFFFSWQVPYGLSTSIFLLSPLLCFIFAGISIKVINNFLPGIRLLILGKT